MLKQNPRNPQIPFPKLTIVLILICVAITVNCGKPANNDTAISNGASPTPIVQENENVRRLKAASKEVVDKLAAEDFTAVTSKFNNKMKRAVSEAKLRNDWAGVIQKYGSYRNQGEPWVSHSQDGMDVVIIRCGMSNGIIDVEIDFDQAGKINGLWFRTLS